MTNKEWIEYYRFHPSEFDAFINFVETSFKKHDSTCAEFEKMLDRKATSAEAYRNRIEDAKATILKLRGLLSVIEQYLRSKDLDPEEADNLADEIRTELIK